MFIALFVEYLLCFLLSHNLHIHMLKTCGLEKQLFLFHVLDLNPIFANQDPSPTIRPRNSCICPYLSRRRRSTHFFSSAGGVNACAGVLFFLSCFCFKVYFKMFFYFVTSSSYFKLFIKNRKEFNSRHIMSYHRFTDK